jgi:ABC-type uncharacterized transport system permease subunit
MKLTWRAATLKNGLQDATAYRLEFLIQVLSSALVPAAIQSILWYAMFVLAGKTQVAGMSYAQMMHYTLTSVLFNQIRGGDNDFELAEMIREGQLSNYLLRPVGVVEFVYLRGLAPKLFIAALSLTVGLAAGWMMGITPIHLLGAMLLALVGNVIYYQLSASLAAIAFIWEEAYGVLMVKNMIVNLLSGEQIPLYLFPAALSWIWKGAPFYLFVFGPTQYALGNWSNHEYFLQLAISAVWLLVGYVMIRICWGLGIKHYLSLGG